MSYLNLLTKRLFFTGPLIGSLALVCASVLQKLYLGVPLFNVKGYVAPIVFGAIAGFLVVFWFIRSQRYLIQTAETAQALAELNEKHELLLQSAGEGIFGINAEGHCSFVNQAASEILGYGREELIGRDMHSIIHHSYADGTPYPREACPLHNGLKTRSPVRGEHETFWHKDGRPVVVQYNAHPLGAEGAEGAVLMVRDVTQEHHMQNQIQYMSRHDVLTGLWNRQAFEQQVRLAVDSIALGAGHHVLCYFDLDQFRIVNDTAGPEMGDALLGQIAEMFPDHIREGDTLARLGGDEFGLLLHYCPVEQAERIVRTILDAVSRFRPQWRDQRLSISISAGLYVIEEQTRDFTDALQCAHKACLIAKEKGRSQFRRFESGDVAFQTLNSQMQWVGRIQRALDENRFFLRYQRIARLPPDSSDIDVFEVLIGLRNESGQTLGPAGFLPAAERYGLITAIDRWVVGKVFDWLEQHPQRHARLDFVSINLSGPSLGDEALLDFIREGLQQRDLPAHKICFEITETEAIRNLSQARLFMQHAKRSGCRFSLDDFGSGMSSFGYLHNLPIDCIKIDGSFVREAAHEPLARAVVESIHHVSRSIGAHTIAEHAEDRETLQLMESIGIDYAQGFVIHHPEPLI